MLTVLESINLSTDYLAKKGIESPRLNAELFLAEILNCKRLDLYLRFEQPLTEPEKNKYREFIVRRGKREPLQYILGHTEFYGMRFEVNPNVLIPRPETEILVETVIENIESEKSYKILDIGCGSGNITLALAKSLPLSKITGIDISEKAVELSVKNAIDNLIQNAVFVESDIFNSDERLTDFDVVVSNPPYVSKEIFASLQEEVRDFEPAIAVTDSDNGYKFYNFIINKSNELLKSGGKLFFEIAFEQGEKVKELMSAKGFINISSKPDLSGIERVVYGELP